MAEKKTTTKPVVNDGRTALANPYNEEMVTIKLFKGQGRYAEDVFVSRNGYAYIIKRGEEVIVPKGIAQILENMEEMDNLAAKRKEEAAKSAKKF